MRNWIARLLKLPTEAQLEAEVSAAAWRTRDSFVETRALADRMAEALEQISVKRIPTAADRQAAVEALAAYRSRGRKA